MPLAMSTTVTSVVRWRETRARGALAGACLPLPGRLRENGQTYSEATPGRTLRLPPGAMYAERTGRTGGREVSDLVDIPTQCGIPLGASVKAGDVHGDDVPSPGGGIGHHEGWGVHSGL